jgi:hypothetical protein
VGRSIKTVLTWPRRDGPLELRSHKSTAFRLLGAVEDRGLVEQIADRGKYRLGFGLVRLAGAVTDRLDITRQGRPVCERLAAELGETVNLAVSSRTTSSTSTRPAAAGPSSRTTASGSSRISLEQGARAYEIAALQVQRKGPARAPARPGAVAAARRGGAARADPAHRGLYLQVV